MATWVVGDIHGCYDEFMELLKNKDIKEDDTIILIGDIIDRGPKSIEMLNWAMENISDNGKYQMILGNHEDNIIRDWNDYFNYHREYQDLSQIDVSVLDCHYHFDTYMYGGGYESLQDVKPFVDWFRTLPLYKHLEIKKFDGVVQKYALAHAWLRGDNPESLSAEDIVWIRDIDMFGDIYDGFDYSAPDGEILIHGHTPTICINDCLKKDKNEVLFREHSINIDCGCVFEKDGGNLAAIRLEDQKVIYARPQVEFKKLKSK